MTLGFPGCVPLAPNCFSARSPALPVLSPSHPGHLLHRRGRSGNRRGRCGGGEPLLRGRDGRSVGEAGVGAVATQASANTSSARRVST